MDRFFLHMTALDYWAVGWFFCCWVGYSLLSERGALAHKGLVGVSHLYRLEWARQMLRRDIRIVDSALVGNLMTSVSFYANTTIYIIAGLMAVMGTLDKVISVSETLPFSRASGRELWEMKLLLLLGIFIYAYFKFTWALRQLNLLSILIGAAPEVGVGETARRAFGERMGIINTLAGDEFNRAIRGYYFGLAALFWFIQPWLFILMTTGITLVLYRRDFSSPTLAALRDPQPDDTEKR